MVYHDVLIAFSILQWFFPGLLLMLEWVNHYNYNCALLIHKIFGKTVHLRAHAILSCISCLRLFIYLATKLNFFFHITVFFSVFFCKILTELIWR